MDQQKELLQIAGGFIMIKQLGMYLTGFLCMVITAFWGLDIYNNGFGFIPTVAACTMFYMSLKCSTIHSVLKRISGRINICIEQVDNGMELETILSDIKDDFERRYIMYELYRIYNRMQ